MAAGRVRGEPGWQSRRRPCATSRPVAGLRRRRLLGQGQKRRLGSVLGVRGIAGQPQTAAQHHGAMPGDDAGKSWPTVMRSNEPAGRHPTRCRDFSAHPRSFPASPERGIARSGPIANRLSMPPGGTDFLGSFPSPDGLTRTLVINSSTLLPPETGLLVKKEKIEKDQASARHRYGRKLAEPFTASTSPARRRSGSMSSR